MGVVHSLDEDQVHRVSNALRESADAIQGINDKFDNVDKHWEKMNEHQQLVSDRIDETLESFALMEDTFNSRIETVLSVVNYATDELTVALEGTLILLSRLDLRKKQTELPKIIIPLAIPLIVLLIELAVANAYLGILLASLPEVRDGYSRYLVGNASCVLMGLSISLLWLGGYRLWLSRKSRYLHESGKQLKARFDRIAQSAGMKDVKTDSSVTTDQLQKGTSGDLRGRTTSWTSDDDVKSSEHNGEDVRCEPSSIMPRYHTRRPPDLVHRRKNSSQKNSGQIPTGYMSPRRQISDEAGYSPTRCQISEEPGDTPRGSPTRRVFSDEKNQKYDARLSGRLSGAMGNRRNNALRMLMEKREERGATSHDRIRDRIAAIDNDLPLFPSRHPRHTDNRGAGALEEQVNELRLRRYSQRESQHESFSPRGSIRRTSKGNEVRRSDMGGMRASQPDFSARSGSGLGASDSHSQRASPEASPHTGSGRIKPHIIKTGGWYFNPMNTQVKWSKESSENSANRSRQPKNPRDVSDLIRRGPQEISRGVGSAAVSSSSLSVPQFSQQISGGMEMSTSSSNHDPSLQRLSDEVSARFGTRAHEESV